ncbi:hypothetical protein C8R44DRAFT_590509, partial [Mycena epipterygia]
SCQEYNGPPACIRVINVACAIASANVIFCTGVACDGLCLPYSPCSLPTNGGFCVVPETQSILV